ncbi:hypothetical protein PV682_35050 [Streptomyces niveiscabiei]|uniref:hypothetical protein n=1 Tax=Streptomyces niveiscabiei TaxID=164115 RepID=UPI0029AFB4B8|nr:hypothetical protein [Streptomyces niveiscabiei]MDX3386626.1 hypothetical protein [Streptomyces niveiscabiei]
MALVAVGLGIEGAWVVFARPRHPFDDARARTGSDLRLVGELVLMWLPSPSDADSPGIDIIIRHASPEGTWETVEVTLQMNTKETRSTTEMFLTVLEGRKGEY